MGAGHRQSKAFLIAAQLPVIPGTSTTKWLAGFEPDLSNSETATTLSPLNDFVEAPTNQTRISQNGSQRQTAEFSEKGWAIYTHRIHTEYIHQQAVVIPSPARREVEELSDAWDIKEVRVK